MDDQSGRGEMTLVFTAAAVGRLAEPSAAVDDARRWSERVGVVADDAPGEVRSALDRAGVEPDFVSGEKGTTGSLAAVRQRFPTDRYVVVGTDDGVRATAGALGWEYLPVEEAAEKAGWTLDDGRRESN